MPRRTHWDFRHRSDNELLVEAIFLVRFLEVFRPDGADIEWIRLSRMLQDLLNEMTERPTYVLAKFYGLLSK